MDAPTRAVDDPWGILLSEALKKWVELRRPGRSAVTEAKRSIARFIDLFGDRPIGSVTRAQITEFRNLVSDLPPRTELGRITASGQTLRQVIETARMERKEWHRSPAGGDEPDRMAPGSVKKDVGALSQIFAAIRTDSGTGTNVAERIPIAGYGKTRRDQKKPHLPLTPDMMQKLFDSPLFTGCAGESDTQRTVSGELLFQDELYWPFLFGVLGGPRLNEIAQIALSDIETVDMRRTYGPEYTGQCMTVHITGTGRGQRVKNSASDRKVVLHDRLLDLGFADYVEKRKAEGKTTLFDFPKGTNAAPTKALSQRLNRYIDRVVTTDDRYVFHSTRHEFTDRAELSDIPARVANSIKGHAHGSVADRYGQVTILAQWINLKKLKVSFIDWDRLIAANKRAELLRGRRVRVSIPID